MDVAKAVGKKIKILREEKILTQQELANKIGSTQKEISLWETGKHLAPFFRLIKIAENFDLSVSYFDVYDEENFFDWFLKN